MTTAAAATAASRPADNKDMLAAGVVALAVLVYVLNTRFDGTWGQGIHLVYSGAAALVVIWLAAQTRVEGDRPPAWQSVMYVASYALSLFALLRLADVFGVDDPLGSSGTVVWVGLLLLGLAAWFASQRKSYISTLLAVVTFGVVVLAFVDWVFSPDGPSTFRWILLLLALGFGAAGTVTREEPRRSVALVNGAGLATLALAATFAGIFGILTAVQGGNGAAGAGWGWELVVVVSGFALIVYAAHAGAGGPAYLGVLNLLAFVTIAAGPSEDGPSLIGWPLVLILLSGALLAVGFRGDVPGR